MNSNFKSTNSTGLAAVF